MVGYIVRRLISAIMLLVVVSMVVFAIFFLVPRLAGQSSYALAVQYVGRDADPASVRAIEKKLGFDQPVPVQYGRFVKGLVFGAHYDAGPDRTYCKPPCFGYSFRSQLEVWPLLKDRLPVTASLAVGGAVIWLAGGVTVGVISALRRGTMFDRVAMITALSGVSLPIFFTGQLALVFIAYGPLNLWPNGVQYVGLTQNPIQWAYNLILPWITLAFLNAALYARLTRAGMLETLGEDYVRTARAKGLPERTVIGKHALRATLTPILTIFGLDLGILLGGAVLTESTYSLAGLGKLAVDAIVGNDLPIVLGVTLLGAFFIVIANLIVDVLYAFVDPRVRHG